MEPLPTGSHCRQWQGGYVSKFPTCEPAAALAGLFTSGIRASINEIVMAERAPDDSFDLFYRAPDGSVHIIADTTGGYTSWESLGGIIKGVPDGIWSTGLTRQDVFVISNDDRPYQKTYRYPSWGGWRQLPGQAG